MPRRRSGKGRGVEGSGLYPELAAYRISEGSSPNVQAKVGRLVGQLPIEQARAELARDGLELDEKAIRRIAGELGAQMLATRTRDLLRFRAGELPAGNVFADKRVAVGIDGGRVRVRTVVENIRVSGKMKRKKFRIEWREPKVVILFETDREGADGQGEPTGHRRHVAGPGCVDRTGGVSPAPAGCSEGQVSDCRGRRCALDLGAVGLGDRPGKAGPGPSGRGARLVSRRASPEPGVGGVRSGPGSAGGAVWPASHPAEGGQSQIVIEELERLGTGQPEGSPVWREIRYLRKHSEAGRLRYNCFRCRGVPLGSGAIESTIRRVINLWTAIPAMAGRGVSPIRFATTPSGAIFIEIGI